MEASKVCCPPGEAVGNSCCKCAPGWTCVIKKIEEPELLTAGEHFTKCSESCVCITDESSKVETEGGFCVCKEGYTCSFVKTEGPDAGKVFFECGNGCRCEISASGDEVVVVKEA
ncbi:uncharacterized protein LOC110681695 [Chenopodium quinoa]|uniref:Uncharacterized protein n=1 Tax=Chenopodium quinoa TaxID=63459 RepID=A0A803KXC6_CHEQI|nr:uncharacterized protein LOC110681695 [Chenopodium quinoa]